MTARDKCCGGGIGRQDKRRGTSARQSESCQWQSTYFLLFREIVRSSAACLAGCYKIKREVQIGSA